MYNWGPSMVITIPGMHPQVAINITALERPQSPFQVMLLVHFRNRNGTA
jgi:hypothetical protein